MVLLCAGLDGIKACGYLEQYTITTTYPTSLWLRHSVGARGTVGENSPRIEQRWATRKHSTLPIIALMFQGAEGLLWWWPRSSKERAGRLVPPGTVPRRISPVTDGPEEGADTDTRAG